MRILTALLGTEHGSKYLLNWLVVPRNPLEPSSLPFYSFISRKDLQCAVLFTCPPTSHPARPLKIFTSEAILSSLKNEEVQSPFTSPAGDGALLGKTKNANNWKNVLKQLSIAHCVFSCQELSERCTSGIFHTFCPRSKIICLAVSLPQLWDPSFPHWWGHSQMVGAAKHTRVTFLAWKKSLAVSSPCWCLMVGFLTLAWWSEGLM